MGFRRGAPVAFAPDVCNDKVFKPVRATSVEVGSATSYCTSEGEISHMRSRTSTIWS